MIRIADSHSDYAGFMALDSCGGRLYNHGGIEEMEKGGVKLQCFAAWVPSEYKNRLECGLKQIKYMHDLIERSDGRMILCTSADDLFSEQPIKAILSIESGETIDFDISVIQVVYDLGVRILSLTWNEENEFACGSNSRGGLKPRGIDAVAEINRLHIALDMSHINEDGFWEAADQYNFEPCATHSCVYDLTPNPRNLKKEQIKYIIDHNGYIGINFYTEFLKGRNATIDDILDHIEYILELGGNDSVGLGSDFCGIQYTPDGFDSVAAFQKIPETMARGNYMDDLISKICYSNFAGYILKFL